MNEQRQNRFLSPVFWSAAAAQVLTLLVYGGVIDVEVSEGARNVICALLELMVTFGILNDPTNKAAI